MKYKNFKNKAIMLSVTILLMSILAFCLVLYVNNYSIKNAVKSSALLSSKKNYKFEKLSNETSSSSSSSSTSVSSSSSTSSSSSSSASASASSSTSSQLPAAGTWKDDFPDIDSNGILGIASEFNIFAKTIQNTNSQSIKGSAATEELDTSPWNIFGTSGISYIQKTLNTTSSFESNADTLIFGDSNSFTYASQYSQYDLNPSINGLELTGFTGKLRQDIVGSKYIDFDEEFDRLDSNVPKVASYVKSSGHTPVVTSPGWEYNRQIDASNVDITNGNTKFINITASDLPTNWGSLTLTGVSDVSNVVFVVDTSGDDSSSDLNYSMSSVSGSSGKNISFIFYNNSSSPSAYTGSITLGFSVSQACSVIAPEATVSLANTSFSGNVVAKKVISTYTTQNDSKASDIDLPSDTSSLGNISVSNIPSVDFGQLGINSVDIANGNWSQNLSISGSKGQELKISVALSNNFENETSGQTADQVQWSLVDSENNQTIPFSTSDPPTASIDYTIQNDNTQESPLKNYYFQISNLKSVKYSGNYKATLTWTFTDGP
ncbi:hypothetical protein ATW79_07330 [Oenococcus oeni]|nr:hypothetical protein ATW79_07330 [Oenococcus oeni]OIL08338.1 hypothetical protein ATW92_07340 [Oenococcus oeni]OIL12374.1 hypothetical protein ATW93_07395 [Oenococcus oeni]